MGLAKDSFVVPASKQGTTMEWLQENFIAPILAALTAWFWYDKRQRDLRLTALEARMAKTESRAETHEGDGRVLTEKLNGMQQLLESKFESISASLDRLENK